MTDALTRRQILGLTGATMAGAAGIAACSSGSGASHASTLAVPVPSTGNGPPYVTRPDLTPPHITITHRNPHAGSGYVFLNAPYSGPGHGGSMIIDYNGDLVWFGPNTRTEHRMNVDVQTYQGRKVLTWWEGLVVQGYGLGRLVIADSSYRVRHVISAANGLMADLHEFVVTPQGTALITAYKRSRADLSSIGGPKSGYLLSGVAQEIDIATGKLLFEWDSRDHVALTETYQKYESGTGTAEKPFNYFHINSIAIDPTDNNLIISSRNTWTVYKVHRPSGRVIWRMNGKMSDFTMEPRTHYYWQHHVRPRTPGVLTVFDNGASPAEEKHSRALMLRVDEKARRVSLIKAYIHPGADLLAGAMGSAQLMPNGNMFAGWGTCPNFSMFAHDGTLLLDGQMTKGDPSYRAFTHPWIGHPTDRPAVAARHRSGGATVYASWNGATQVAFWTVLAGKTRSTVSRIGRARKSGFETVMPVHGAGPFFAVEARDSSGRLLARSPIVEVR